jgi:transcriptional accessory protein Tex/SPT6
VKHPSELYKKGDEVEAVVLGIDVDNERISLGIKQITEDPWSAVPKRYPAGTRVKGAVTSVTDFGVFVELEEGVEGLVHVSQLSTERVDKPSSLFKPGDVIEAEVTNVDPREKRIGLSVKALRKSEERADMEAYLSRDRDSGSSPSPTSCPRRRRPRASRGWRPVRPTRWRGDTRSCGCSWSWRSPPSGSSSSSRGSRSSAASATGASSATPSASSTSAA